MNGRLELIMGCMFSGKSTELIRRLKRYKAINKNILVINSAKDTRSTEQVLKTHDGVTFNCIKTNNLNEIFKSKDFRNVEIIGIDEGQFFNGLYDFVMGSLNLDKHVIVASLDGDSNQETFGETLSLIPIADEVDKLKAFCMECNDGTPAPFSKRITMQNEGQELVGDNDIYRAVCRKHLFDPVDLLLEKVVRENIF